LNVAKKEAPKAEPKKFAEVIREAMQAVNDDGSREKSAAVKNWITENYIEHADTAGKPQFSSVLSQARKKAGLSAGRAPRATTGEPDTTTPRTGVSPSQAIRDVRQAMKTGRTPGEQLEAVAAVVDKYGLAEVKAILAALADE
jgi:hypothetical protein